MRFSESINHLVLVLINHLLQRVYAFHSFFQAIEDKNVLNTNPENQQTQGKRMLAKEASPGHLAKKTKSWWHTSNQATALYKYVHN